MNDTIVPGYPDCEIPIRPNSQFFVESIHGIKMCFSEETSVQNQLTAFR